MLMRIILALFIILSLTPGFEAELPSLAVSQSASEPYPGTPEAFFVEFFPVAPYHVGDILSLRVTYSGAEYISGLEMQISLADQPEDVLESATFSRSSRQAIFFWVLDTSSLEPGFLAFQLKIPEMDLVWQTGVNLLPLVQEQTSTWVKHPTNCCTIYYLSGTDAEQDIAMIEQILEQQTAEALSQFQSKIDTGEKPLEDPLSLVLIPIVIGQGGFATDIAVMTYSRRNWVGTDFSNIAHHEIVHVLDRKLNDGIRPSLFAEGIAVFLSGGHYRDADPLQRAAALLAIDRYIPLSDFVDDFYAAQHEISYMQAAGLVAYLEKTWGWERFLDFYFSLPDANRDSESIAIALADQFGITMAELENDYIAYLQSLPIDKTVQENVRLTIETYDMMRRYQQVRIPSAYFRNAWWPPIDKVLEMDIVGDYAWREKAPVDIIIESLFLEIYPALDAGNNQYAEENLKRIAELLDQADSAGQSFSHYGIGWPLPHTIFDQPGFKN